MAKLTAPERREKLGRKIEAVDQLLSRATKAGVDPVRAIREAVRRAERKGEGFNGTHD